MEDQEDAETGREVLGPTMFMFSEEHALLEPEAISAAFSHSFIRAGATVAVPGSSLLRVLGVLLLPITTQINCGATVQVEEDLT